MSFFLFFFEETKKQHTLTFHFCADSSLFHVEDQGAVRGVTKIPVPAIFPSRFFPCGGGARARRRLGGGQSFDDAESLVEEDTLVVVNDGIDLGLDALPDLVKGILAEGEFMTETLEIGLDAKFVVGSGVAEVEASGNSEVGLEDEGELRDDALATGAGVCDEETGL